MGKDGNKISISSTCTSQLRSGLCLLQTRNGAYKGKTTLRKVVLSEPTRNIEDGAFKGCEQLSICQIKKKNPPNPLPGKHWPTV